MRRSIKCCTYYSGIINNIALGTLQSQWLSVIIHMWFLKFELPMLTRKLRFGYQRYNQMSTYNNVFSMLSAH